MKENNINENQKLQQSCDQMVQRLKDTLKSDEKLFDVEFKEVLDHDDYMLEILVTIKLSQYAVDNYIASNRTHIRNRTNYLTLLWDREPDIDSISLLVAEDMELSLSLQNIYSILFWDCVIELQ